MAMRYTNKKVPLDVAFMETGKDVAEVVRTLVGHECEVIYDLGAYPSGGSSPFGPWEEADVAFVDDDNTHVLAYDFMALYDEGIARIFRYEIY